MKLSDLNLEKGLESIFGDSDIKELYPPQEEAIRAGILAAANKNFVIASPTASGKTLLAELVMLKSILTASGKCLYVVPLNALAYEKYQNFKDKFSSVAKIGISTGDYESSSRYLERYDVILLTLEKLDSLTRIKPSWLRKCSVVVVDEVHVLGDEKRGPRLEGAMARFMSFNPSARIIALSATIPNAAEFGNWLHASLIQSEWRPVPLKEEVFLAEDDKKIIERVIEEVKEGSQVLVFVNTKRGSASFARKIAAQLKMANKELDKLADTVDIGVDDLGDMVRCGVAYHNSWLHPEQRRAMEESFRARVLKVICCTPTLAMGVSLPARMVLIRNYKFFTLGRGNEPMPVCWVKQVFGRAGRPEHDEYGIGLIVARSEDEFEEIEEFYINGELERIESQFSVETMTEQVLATIVGGAHRMDEILEFLDSTFYAYQNRDEMALQKEEMDDILVQLSEDGFITMTVDGEKEEIKATDFGSLSSRLYLSTKSALELRRGIKILGDVEMRAKISDFDLLLLLCKCDEVVPLKVKEAMGIASILSDNLEWLYGGEYALGSAIVAHAWIDEITYPEMKEKFGIYPGEIHNNIYVLGWMCYAASRLAEYLRDENMYARLNVLKDRIRQGVKTEVLRLVSIKGVGRVIARGLYSAGFRNPGEVAKADVAQLERVPGVGEKRARKIKEEALLQCET
ncbi:MAG: DEAD/DEAH box helicase [Candidatus Syntrophoarchaeum sp.]|nr:DEAD/DEAH box helicase [Candidatus Syntrophoarchaeum sp.]